VLSKKISRSTDEKNKIQASLTEREMGNRTGKRGGRKYVHSSQEKHHSLLPTERQKGKGRSYLLCRRKEKNREPSLPPGEGTRQLCRVGGEKANLEALPQCVNHLNNERDVIPNPASRGEGGRRDELPPKEKEEKGGVEKS